jgi:hypothetical protein
MQTQWQDEEWLAGAYAWVDEQLGRQARERSGDFEQPHVRIWSTVLKAPTTDGLVWFKANMDLLRHEAAVVDILARRRPDVIPPLLGIDRERGWMLMADAGEQLRTVISRERSLNRWIDVLGRYAEVQLAIRDDVDELLAAGVPDMRISGLAESYDQLVHELDVEQRFRDATPRVAELAEELARTGIPDTIQHDDLHDAQVFVKNDRHLVMDWGDACITHPFLTLSVTLEGVIAWGLDDVENSEDVAPYRDSYLKPFAAEYPGDLDGAVEIALRLGWACRAVNGHVPGDDGPTFTRLKMFIDGRP